MTECVSISAVIITYNEERTIQRCLESLKGIADEIIVVDSLSTDRTEQICRQYNVTFETQAWQGYSAQKNFGNSLATGEYILSVDADEVLSAELKKSILEIKKNPGAQVYRFSRFTNYCGHWIRHGGWYPDKKIRIWKRDLAEWIGDIHETVRLKTETRVEELKGDLLHYSFYTVDEHIRQINLFTEIMAEHAWNTGMRVSGLKLFFSPMVKFMKSYFIQRGFLDGYYGFIVSVISAHATFYKYLKIRERMKLGKQNA